MEKYKEYIENERLREYQVLLSLANTHASGSAKAEAAWLLDGGRIDWNRVLCMADKHRLSSILYFNAKKSGLLAYLPENVRQNLYWKYMKIVGDNLKLRKKLLDILALFESRQIPAVPVKGPVLSQILYADSELRYYQDLDILVPKNSVTAARDALLECGFAMPESLAGKSLEKFLDYGKECDFVDHGKKIAIDLHWQLGVPFRGRFDYHFCKERLRTVRFHCRNVRSLSLEDTLLHLCVHGTHEIWSRIEQVLSVARLIKMYPNLDWEMLVNLSDQLHCKRVLFTGLFLSIDVFDAPIPPVVTVQIKYDKTVKRIAANIFFRLFMETAPKEFNEKRAEQISFDLKIREHPHDKVLYLLRRVFVPTGKDWEKREWNSRFPLLFFISRPWDLALELLPTCKQMIKRFF